MTPLSVQPVPWSLVEPVLRRLPQYTDTSRVRISPEDVPTDELLPLCRCVRTYRLARIRELADAYRTCCARPFAGVRVETADRGSHLLAPPIVERQRGRLVIVDGLHRVFHCRESGVRAVSVAVVRGGLPPLPAETLAWEDVVTTALHVPRREKFRNLDERWFRDVAGFVDCE